MKFTILNILFNNYVKLKNITFVPTNFKGSKGSTLIDTGKHDVFDSNIRYFGGKGGNSADNNIALEPYDENGTNGADVLTVRTGHSTDYPEYIVGTNSVENDHVVKCYKWVEKN